MPTPLVAVENDNPKDCVCEAPSLSPEHVELKAYDWSGQVRHRMDVPVEDNVRGWAALMLKQCRRLYPRPASHLQLLG